MRCIEVADQAMLVLQCSWPTTTSPDLILKIVLGFVIVDVTERVLCWRGREEDGGERRGIQ